MLSRLTVLIPLLAALALAGCAGPSGPRAAGSGPAAASGASEAQPPQVAESFAAAPEAHLEQILRLHRIYAPLLRAAAELDQDLCKSRSLRHDGFLAIDRTSFGPGAAEALASRYALPAEGLKAISVPANLAASREGMVAGDVIVSVNDVKVSGDSARGLARRAMDEAVGKHRFDLLRDGQIQLRGDIAGETLCAVPVFIADTAGTDLLHDGTSILIHRGLLQALDSDRDLAAVLAHELAQVLAQTRIPPPTPPLDPQPLFSPVLSARTGWGGLAGAVEDPLTAPFPLDTLLKADAQALRLLTAAGLDSLGYELTWRRLSATKADLVRIRPVTAERLAGIGTARSTGTESAPVTVEPEPKPAAAPPRRNRRRRRPPPPDVNESAPVPLTRGAATQGPVEG